MKFKILSVLSTVLFSSASFAGGPEIWWAIRVDCNVFQNHVSVHLNEKNGNAVTNSYVGTGIYKYETLTFNECTNDDDSITCEGTSNGLHPEKRIQLSINRRTDGTFFGTLDLGRGTPLTLGCLLSR